MNSLFNFFIIIYRNIFLELSKIFISSNFFKFIMLALLAILLIANRLRKYFIIYR